MAAIFLELPPYVADEPPELAVRRLHSYLYQAAERMNEALQLVDTSIADTAKAAQAQLASVSQALTGTTQRMSNNAQQALLREAESLRSLILDNARVIEDTRTSIIQQIASEYVAQSDFGTYKEQAVRQMEDTADGRIEQYNRSETITQLQADSDAAKTFQRDYDAYIKTGLLFRENGIPVFGVAVGENLKRVIQIVDGHEEVVLDQSGISAVFTASKLSFYQNAREVAWLSNHSLNITQAVVKERFQLGLLVFSVDPNGIGVTWASEVNV